MEKKLYVAIKSNNVFVEEDFTLEEVKTVEEGKKLIEDYEKEDRQNGCYAEDQYYIIER